MRLEGKSRAGKGAEKLRMDGEDGGAWEVCGEKSEWGRINV
jgi:hypothetical protein